MDSLDKLIQISAGFAHRFGGSDPYQIMTRLLEEAGELAAEVSHFEAAGVKVAKHGAPDSQHLAEEASQLLGCVMDIVRYYGVAAELRAAIDTMHARLLEEGHIGAVEL